MASNGHNSLLDIADWDPVSLSITYQDGRGKRKYFDSVGRKRAWESVFRHVNRMVYHNVEAARLGHGAPKQDRVRPFRVVRGQFVYHSSMADIVDKLYDPSNAVLVSPGSWVDKKLQEVYNSKRTQNKQEAK